MDNKKLPLIIGGACALIGGALLYHYWTSTEGEAEDKFAELHAELGEFGPVKKDATGYLVLDDFLKIFRIVTKHSKKQIAKFKADTTEARRKCLRDGNDEGYRECIKNQISQEETIYQDVATEVLTFLDIEEQEFMMAQNMHAMNPMFQKVMMEMQLGMEEGPQNPPSFDKAKAKEIFIFVEEEKAKEMAKIKGSGGIGGMGAMMGGQDMESTINMIVAHSKVGDKLYEKFGVEEEEFAKSIQYYNLIQDPDIQKLMQQSLMGMGPEALQMIAQMQGGAPGGAPPAGMGF